MTPWRVILAKLALEEYAPHELTWVAVELLEQGFDSLGLRSLAGLADDESLDAPPLLAEALRQAGLALPNRREAAQTLFVERCRYGLNPRVPWHSNASWWPEREGVQREEDSLAQDAPQFPAAALRLRELHCSVVLRARAPMPLSDGLCRELVEAWTSEGRAYHTLQHLDEVLEWYAELDWEHPREVFLALAFHDAVYVPGAHDNEEQSVALMRAHAPDAGPWAERLIRLTARHGSLQPADVTAEEALFVDVDMAILGAPPARFDEYDAQVRKEYAALPDAVYEAGRRAFLGRVLSSERIFLSAHFHAALDAQARANLRRRLGA